MEKNDFSKHCLDSTIEEQIEEQEEQEHLQSEFAKEDAVPADVLSKYIVK